MIKKIFVKGHIDDADRGEAEAEGTTFDGAPIKTKAPLKLLPKPQGRMCG